MKICKDKDIKDRNEIKDNQGSGIIKYQIEWLETDKK